MLGTSSAVRSLRAKRSELESVVLGRGTALWVLAPDLRVAGTERA
jgi:hypothetical protein